MAFNIIEATFGGLRTTTTAKIRQWAQGQILKINNITDLPSVFTAYFSNSPSRGEAKPWIGSDGEVAVLDEYFETGADVYCFIMVHESADDQRYEWVIRIPVDPAPKPGDEEPTPTQQNVIDQLVVHLNEAVEQTGNDVEDADRDARAAAQSASDAEQHKSDARGYAENAARSKTEAENAARTAVKAKEDAEAAETAIKEMTASAHTLAAGSEATVTKTEGETTFNLDFGIPQGAKGAPGPKGDTYELTQADRKEIADLATEALIERIEKIEKDYDDLGLSVVNGMIHTTYDKQEDEE